MDVDKLKSTIELWMSMTESWKAIVQLPLVLHIYASVNLVSIGSDNGLIVAYLAPSHRDCN